MYEAKKEGCIRIRRKNKIEGCIRKRRIRRKDVKRMKRKDV